MAAATISLARGVMLVLGAIGASSVFVCCIIRFYHYSLIMIFFISGLAASISGAHLSDKIGSFASRCRVNFSRGGAEELMLMRWSCLFSSAMFAIA